MRFIIMRKADEKSETGAAPGPEARRAMAAYKEALAQAGALVGDEGLRPSAEGMRVRLADGRLTVTEGPFAEPRELVGGFVVIETGSKDEAIGWARRWPSLDRGGEGELELRQVYELSDFPVDAGEQPEGWRDQERRLREEQAAVPPAPPRRSGVPRSIVMLRSDRMTESGALPKPPVLAAMGALMDDLARAGALVGGEGLKPSAKGARVRFRGGNPTVTDGPFTETKELIAGYTIVQLAGREALVTFARRWLTIHQEGSNVPDAELEIRPLLEPDPISG